MVVIRAWIYPRHQENLDEGKVPHYCADYLVLQLYLWYYTPPYGNNPRRI